MFLHTVIFMEVTFYATTNRYAYVYLNKEFEFVPSAFERRRHYYAAVFLWMRLRAKQESCAANMTNQHFTD